MLRTYLLSILIFLSSSCSDSLPSNVLPPDKLSDVMVEVYILRASLELLPLDVRDSIIQDNKIELLKKFEVSDTLFNQSLEYYNQSQDAMKVLEKLIEQKLEAKIPKDSLNYQLNKDSVF